MNNVLAIIKTLILFLTCMDIRGMMLEERAVKALVATGLSHPAVEFADVDEPVPRAGEAVVEVAAFSVNRGETFQLEAPRAHWRPGKDVAGTIVRPAADGSGPEAGRRVVAHPPGFGWAERAAVPTEAIAAVPEDVTTVQAAALPLAGLTALRLLRAAGSVAGRRILLTGASGGVGHYVAELAAAAGAEVTAVTSSPERGEGLLRLGAAKVVHEIPASGEPYDLVLESVGGASLTRALARLRRRGTLIWFGQAGRAPATLDFFGLFDGPESATIRHFHYADSDVPDGDDLATLVRLVAGGRLHPEIGRTADWADTATILTDLRERRVRGNAVLTLGGGPR
jgi:NADPH:quinone reductase-like Zn-dependent oxidoreductase